MGPIVICPIGYKNQKKELASYGHLVSNLFIICSCTFIQVFVIPKNNNYIQFLKLFPPDFTIYF